MKKVFFIITVIVVVVVAFCICGGSTQSQGRMEEEQFFQNFRKNSIQMTVRERAIVPNEFSPSYSKVAFLLTGEDEKGQSFCFAIYYHFPFTQTRKINFPRVWLPNGKLREKLFLNRPTRTFGEWWFDCQPGTTLYLLSDKPFVAGGDKINEICQKFVFFNLEDLPRADLIPQAN